MTESSPELNHIHQLLEDARKHGLETECVWSAMCDLIGNTHAVGDPTIAIVEACAHARREWDI